MSSSPAWSTTEFQDSQNCLKKTQRTSGWFCLHVCACLVPTAAKRPEKVEELLGTGNTVIIHHEITGEHLILSQIQSQMLATI